MRISHRYKFVFFSFPKAGSSSVRLVLNPYTDIKLVRLRQVTPEHPFYDHMLPVELKAVFEQRGWAWDEYYKFITVRNPWARLVSVYAAILDRGFPGRVRDAANWASKRFRGRGLDPDIEGFRAWVRTVETSGAGGGGKEHHGWRRKGTWSTSAFVCDASGKELVDEVIRLEDAHERLPQLALQLKLPNPESVRLPHKNRHEHAHYSAYYDDATAALVADLYAEDISRFHYRFGG
ncbi:MAG: sulfotransferase family 2 domain-containing protein [Gammaproteobacteria bacterium]|nr:sulfotransferase family 2 domain-containing protein [Gammaproteobacteria bacterium]